MEVYIARQPIFDVHLKLFGYELLYRESMGKDLVEVDGNRATCSLLSSTFLTEGIEKIAGNKIVFINFTEQLLEKSIASFFPRNKIVVEILEDVPPSSEVVAACRNLKKKGYILALDDFVYAREMLPLVELADFVKIDIRRTPRARVEQTLYRLSSFRTQLVAERVETHQEYEWANRLGFTHFQGFFFSMPQQIHIREIASTKLVLLNLLVEINRKSTTLDRLEEMITSDVGLTYKLLRYINSAYYYLLQEVKSVRHAIVCLGEKGVRTFINLVIISELAMDKPAELIRLSLVRARFCELLAKSGRQERTASQLFLLGLFSLLDSILDTPMDYLMTRLPLGADLSLALTGRKGPYAAYLDAVIAYEHGAVDRCLAALQIIGVDQNQAAALYLEAVEFTQRIMEQ